MHLQTKPGLILRVLLCSIIITKSFITKGQNAFPSTGNVGIGTTSPLATLDVVGSLRATNYVTPSSGTGLEIYYYSPSTQGKIVTYDRTALAYKQLVMNDLIYAGGGVTGYVGIGTSTASTKFHIYSNSTTLSNSNFITIDNRGSNASYTTTHVIGGILFAGYRDIRNPANIAGIWAVRSSAATGLASYGDLVFGASNNYGTNITTDNTLPTERMRILANGNVLIGQSTQVSSEYKLDVDGPIRADKVVVNTTGADFVFDSSYKIMPLQKLDFYLQQNHHLPDIKSASEMQKNGIDLGENQTTLLQKTEELTLYIIDQNKKLEQQQSMIELLQAQLEKQKEELDELKKKIE